MKIICIGRNFVEHAAELNNEVPEHPVVFMKPATSLLVNNKPFYIPEFTREVHFEVEWVIRICKNGRHIQPDYASTYYREMAIGIDLTARDVQSTLKKKGQPWEIAKGFDDSAPLSSFVPLPDKPLEEISFHLEKNGKIVQKGMVGEMVFSPDELICYTSRFFRLQMGDILFTGTPSGVGKIEIGDRLEGYLEGEPMLRCEIR